MNRTSLFKLLGFAAVLLLLAFVQPLAEELQLEVGQLHAGVNSFSGKLVEVLSSPEPTPLTVLPIETEVLGASSSAELYQVVSVTDGDTLKVTINSKTETVRVIGINTPETVDPRKPVECFGKQASDRAKQILTGQKVSLEADPSQSDRDRYGRLLRYIFLENGTDYGLAMIKDGYAQEYTYQTPHKYQLQYRMAQQEAQQAQRGLWAEDACAAAATPSS